MSFFSRLTDPFEETDLVAPDYVHIVHSNRAKRLALRLDSKDRMIRLTIPPSVSNRHAQNFLDQHTEWMEEKILSLPPSTPFLHGTEIPVLGRLRRIDVEQSPDAKRTSISLDGGVLRVKTNKDDPSSRIERFLRKEAKNVLSQLSHDKAGMIDKAVKAITVRDTKTRWGSCSVDGALSYSWRLIFAPYEAMDYVVAHEVAHLVHMDHSKAFWGVCAQLSDDYVEGKYWMQNHGNELMAFG